MHRYNCNLLRKIGAQGLHAHYMQKMRPEVHAGSVALWADHSH